MTFGDVGGVPGLITTTMRRLGDDPTLPGNQRHYTYDEIRVALNSVLRLFVLLTLCLETTASLALDSVDGLPFYRLLNTFADWLLPLRIRIVGGAKLKSATLAELAALDSKWTASAGTPIRYSLTGFDLLGVYQQPTIATSLSITYARCPALLQLDTDVPEIPDRYHNNLIDGAIPLLRAKEGASEWQKVLPLWNRYLDAATELSEKVRARNREQGYDHEPFELKLFDRSTLLKETAAK
jgi:hypothetical protein